jgi:hypothetical protein
VETNLDPALEERAIGVGGRHAITTRPKRRFSLSRAKREFGPESWAGLETRGGQRPAA